MQKCDTCRILTLKLSINPQDVQHLRRKLLKKGSRENGEEEKEFINFWHILVIGDF